MNCSIIAPLSRANHSALLKLYSQVSCGFPLPSEDWAEPELSLDELVNVRAPSTYLVRAYGDSMVGAGIYDGDVLVVDKATEPVPGCVIVACIDQGFVAKTYRLQDNGCPALYAENPDYPPILLGPDDQLECFGVCTWNLHQLLVNR